MTATIALTPEPDEIEVLDWVQTYSDAKRLAPSRAHELVEKAMASEMPEPPDADVSFVCAMMWWSGVLERSNCDIYAEVIGD